jgi:hypothetical protein
MNILFVAPRIPWPLDTGGKIRTFNPLARIPRACPSGEPVDEGRIGTSPTGCPWGSSILKQIRDAGHKVTLICLCLTKGLGR